MYMALINMRLTNTNSKTVAIYDKWFVQLYKMQNSLNITKGCFPNGKIKKLHVLN